MWRPRRPAELGRVVDRRLLERRLEPVGQVVRVPGGERGLLHGHRAVGALDAERAAVVLEVVLGHLERVGDDLLRLRDHLVGRVRRARPSPIARLRLPYVSIPSGTIDVSPWSTSTSS